MSDMLKALNTDKITAMKAGDRTRKDIIVLIINEANTIAKNDPKAPSRAVTDDDVMQALNRTIKKAREAKDILAKREMDTSIPDNEIEVAQSYLPQQMSRDDLRAKIVEIVGGETATKQQRGLVMGGLNKSYKGQFDNAMANEILGEMMEG